MTKHGMTETIVEQAAMDWLATVGWQVMHGPDIAPDSDFAERDSFADVVLAGRLREALAAYSEQARTRPTNGRRPRRRCLSRRSCCRRSGRRREPGA